MDGDFRYRGLNGHPMSAFLSSSVRDGVVIALLAAGLTHAMRGERRCPTPVVF
jgi:hypothetical protein